MIYININSDFKYSLDKLKVSFFFSDIKYVEGVASDLLTQANYFNARYKVQYESNALTKCKRSFLVQCLEGNVYIGFEPNWLSERGRSARTVILEYNPNKVKLSEVKRLLEFPFKAREIDFMSVDIAVDMDCVELSDLVVKKWDNRVKYVDFGSSDVETKYLGAIGHNHIKIYNKALEQKIKDIVWTRFEITLKKVGKYMNFEIPPFHLPKLYNRNFQSSLIFEQLDNKDKFYFYSYLNNPELLQLLNFRTRKRVLSLVDDYLSEVVISESEIRSVLKRYKFE